MENMLSYSLGHFLEYIFFPSTANISLLRDKSEAKFPKRVFLKVNLSPDRCSVMFWIYNIKCLQLVYTQNFHIKKLNTD